MTSSLLTYHISAERPEAVITLPDALDVSTGYTFSLKIGHVGSAALLTKTTGITGGVGTVTVAWTAGELAGALAGGVRYTAQLTCTTGGLDRVYEGQFAARGVIT